MIDFRAIVVATPGWKPSAVQIRAEDACLSQLVVTASMRNGSYIYVDYLRHVK
ncbi:hypothetical protein [Nitrosospira multiformis]|uniref:hypothetical protein n=1 Tax=Nitrosospira multiformis TaxID=1231 RepID=UPI0015E6809A|nr:hypothetical protein [Nitrosospira multiformis]